MTAGERPDDAAGNREYIERKYEEHYHKIVAEEAMAYLKSKFLGYLAIFAISLGLVSWLGYEVALKNYMAGLVQEVLEDRISTVVDTEIDRQIKSIMSRKIEEQVVARMSKLETDGGTMFTVPVDLAGPAPRFLVLVASTTRLDGLKQEYRQVVCSASFDRTVLSMVDPYILKPTEEKPHYGLVVATFDDRGRADALLKILKTNGFRQDSYVYTIYPEKLLAEESRIIGKLPTPDCA